MTEPAQAAPSLIVIYAQDRSGVAEFYTRTLSRPIVERDAGFIVVGDASVEVSLVHMPDSIAAANPSRLHLDGHDPEGNPVQFRVSAV